MFRRRRLCLFVRYVPLFVRAFVHFRRELDDGTSVSYLILSIFLEEQFLSQL